MLQDSNLIVSFIDVICKVGRSHQKDVVIISKVPKPSVAGLAEKATHTQSTRSTLFATPMVVVNFGPRNQFANMALPIMESDKFRKTLIGQTMLPVNRKSITPSRLKIAITVFQIMGTMILGPTCLAV